MTYLEKIKNHIVFVSLKELYSDYNPHIYKWILKISLNPNKSIYVLYLNLNLDNFSRYHYYYDYF